MKKILILLMAFFMVFSVSSFGQDKNHRKAASGKIESSRKGGAKAVRPGTSKSKKTVSPPKSKRPGKKSSKRKTSGIIKV